MARMRLTERFAFTGGKVCRPGVDGYAGAYPVIKDVLLCGPASLNGRDYPASAFPAGKKLYEGKPVFLDHGNESKDRGYREKIGWIENERRRGDGMPIGDIAVKPTHREAESVLWDAEHKPDFAGMSHVAECERIYVRGREKIESVVNVESVDIVVSPATTKGFFESKGKRTMAKISLKTLCERIGPKLGPEKWGRLKKLSEMEGVDAEVEEPAEDATAEATLEDAMCTLAVSVMKAALAGDITADEAGSKIAAFIQTHQGESGGEGSEGSEEESTKAKGTAITEAKGTAITEAIAVFDKIGHRPSGEEIEIVAAVPAARREQLAKRFKLASEGAVGDPKSGAADPPKNSKLKESKIPTDLSKVEW